MTPRPAERLVVVCGGGEHCAPDYRIHRNDFRFFGVEFVARGEGQLHLGGKSHDLVPGAVFAYGPGVAHDIQSHPDRPLVKYFVDFAGGEALALLKSPAPAPGQIVQTSAPEQVLQLFEDLIAAGLRQSALSGRICAAILRLMLLRVADTAAPLGSIGTMAFDTFQQCRQLIDAHYRDLHGLDDAADRCGVDPAYLCRLFARFDHQSPYQYLTRLKMRQAAERLQTPGMLAKQVAADMGFSDPFHFSRTFRRVFGVSPKRFVQLQRKER